MIVENGEFSILSEETELLISVMCVIITVVLISMLTYFSRKKTLAKLLSSQNSLYKTDRNYDSCFS